MLDRIINGIEIRFNQETINMIKCVARLIKQEVSNDDVINLSEIFGVDFCCYCARNFILCEIFVQCFRYFFCSFSSVHTDNILWSQSKYKILRYLYRFKSRMLRL